jgi:predicted Rossmann-fold nucleotide-binding protein
MNLSATENLQPIRQIKRICVFCGSSTGSRAAYAEAAVLLGRELANSRVALVFAAPRFRPK